jgi:hypothetical protein
VTIRAHPRRNSHMKTMIASQKTRQGKADHFASSRLRNPNTIGNQRGRVWTSWRRDPLLTAPTTYSAIKTASEQEAIHFEALRIQGLIRGDPVAGSSFSHNLSVAMSSWRSFLQSSVRFRRSPAVVANSLDAQLCHSTHAFHQFTILENQS